jgi:hypothetical protein
MRLYSLSGLHGDDAKHVQSRTYSTEPPSRGNIGAEELSWRELGEE